MNRRPWILIGLVVLFSWTITAADAADQKMNDCVKACVDKNEPCYAKCDAAQKACHADVLKKCKKSKVEKTCVHEGNRECDDEKSIHCAPLCGTKVLECITQCQQ